MAALAFVQIWLLYLASHCQQFEVLLFLELIISLLYFPLSDYKKRTLSRLLGHDLEPSLMAMFVWRR